MRDVYVIQGTFCGAEILRSVDSHEIGICVDPKPCERSFICRDCPNFFSEDELGTAEILSPSCNCGCANNLSKHVKRS